MSALRILSGIIFVLTSGAVFSSYYKGYKIAAFLAALVAIVSSSYLLRSIYADVQENLKVPIEPPSKPKEALQFYRLTDLRMVGTLRDNDKVTFGLLTTPDGTFHRVKNGNYIGEHFGEIVNITTDLIMALETKTDGGGGWKEEYGYLYLNK
jgi:Tfp pilus assembly protein PilP